MKKATISECGETTISKSLTDWVDTITCKMGFMKIVELLDRVFNNGLIDGSEKENVHISDEDAYSLINGQLILTGTPIEDIANALHERKLYDLFNNLVNLVVKINQSPEVLSDIAAKLKAQVEDTLH